MDLRDLSSILDLVLSGKFHNISATPKFNASILQEMHIAKRYYIYNIKFGTTASVDLTATAPF